MKPSIYFNRMACAAIAMSLSLAMQAQTQDRKLCDFETSEACLSIGAYDTWESSPLRKGAMAANVRVVRNHLTFGATWTQPGGGELSGFIGHAFGKTVQGVNSIPRGMPPAGLGGGNATLHMKETMVGISYGWKL